MVYRTKTTIIQQYSISMNHNGANLEILYKTLFAEMFTVRQQIYMKI